MIYGLVILIVLVIIVLVEYNSLVRLSAKIKRSKSLIDVYSKQRFDLIPNLVETIKAYTKYESETYEKVVELRNVYNTNHDIETAMELDKKLNVLIARVEAHPDLKASEQFLNLQKTLSKMESQLQAARRIYNIDVTTYNTRIETIPHSIFASIFGYKKENWFELDSEEESKVVNVDLN